jgi:pyrrolidone-carboxylate peptidase
MIQEPNASHKMPETVQSHLRTLRHGQLLDTQAELCGTIERSLRDLCANIEASGLRGDRHVTLAKEAGEALFAIACAAARTNDGGFAGHFDPLHRMRAAIRALGGIYPAIPATQTPAELARAMGEVDRAFELSARGATTVCWARARPAAPAAHAAPAVKVLVVGFDPFADDGTNAPRFEDLNPAGAAAMSLAGETVGDGTIEARVESIIMPVSFRSFRDGIVERSLRAQIAAADAILTVGLYADLVGSVRMEQLAVGVHGLGNRRTHALMPQEVMSGTEMIPGYEDTDVGDVPRGPPLLASSADFAAIAAELREAHARHANVLPATTNAATVLDLGTGDAAREARDALRAVADDPAKVALDATGTRVRVSDMGALDVLAKSASWVDPARGRIRFVLDEAREATLLEGPAGAFLCNEVYYRASRHLAARGSKAICFHTHVPPVWTAKPSSAGKLREDFALQVAGDVERHVKGSLVPTLKAVVLAVARQVPRV